MAEIYSCIQKSLNMRWHDFSIYDIKKVEKNRKISKRGIAIELLNFQSEIQVAQIHASAAYSKYHFLIKIDNSFKKLIVKQA